MGCSPQVNKSHFTTDGHSVRLCIEPLEGLMTTSSFKTLRVLSSRDVCYGERTGLSATIWRVVVCHCPGNLFTIFTVYQTAVIAQSGYGLDDRDSNVRFPVGAGNFSFYHRVHNGSGAHPASSTMDTGGSFPGD